VGLALLLWPACAAGGFLGAVVGVVLGAVDDDTGGWAAIGWGFVGSILGVAVGAGILGWLWALVCRRRRLLPIVGLVLLAGVGAAVGFPLIVAVPGSSNDALRIAACSVIVVVVTTLVFLVGRSARPRSAGSPVASGDGLRPAGQRGGDQ
jgi:hypothetical protein